MASKKELGVQIVWQQVSVVEGFSSVLYPLDIYELLKQLPNLGYVVPDLVLRGTPEQSRPIATKGDIELTINQDNKTIGVRGRDTKKAVASYQELKDFYLNMLDPSPGLATRYLEFDGHGWAKSSANPTEVFTKFWHNHGPLQEFRNILEENVTDFGLHLVPPNKDPNNSAWFHLIIEPHVSSSKKRYRIRWIWRGTDTEKLLKKFSKVDETLQRLISKIEG